MTNRSCIVRGDATLKPCVKHAANLIYDVYDLESSGRHIAPAVKKAIAETKKHYPWPGEKTANTDESSGYHARFYEPLNGDKYKDCPPALVFRGSDSGKDDFRDLTISYRIELRNFRYTGQGVSEAVNRGFENIDRGLEWIKNKFPDTWWYPLDMNDLARAVDFVLPDGTPTLPNIPDQDFSGAFSLKGNEPNLSLKGTQSIFAASGRHKFRLKLNFLLKVWLEFDWHLAADLHYGENGDWGANVTQALGGVGRQYELAMEDAVEYAQQAVKYRRLIIIGHSLGGGLASAAAAVAKHKNPRLTVLSRTFNSSGLHKNTTKSEIAPVGGGNTQSRAVEDEILTTLQSHPGNIPMLKPFLDWAKGRGGSYRGQPGKFTGLPEARVSLSERNGISPGKNLEGRVYSEAWSCLPDLFPLNHDRFKNLLMLDSWGRNLSPERFVARLVGWALTGDKNGGNETDLEISLFNLFKLEKRTSAVHNELLNISNIIGMSVDYHLADMCLFTYILDKEKHG